MGHGSKGPRVYVWIAGVIAALLVSPRTAEALTLKLSLLKEPSAGKSSSRPADSGSVEATIALGVPLYIRLELFNEGAQPTTVLPSLDPASGLVRLLLVGPGDSISQFTTRRWEIYDMYVKPRALAPGETIVHETFLFGRFPAVPKGGDLQYLFPRPATYALYARYSCPDPALDVTSNRVTVHVGAPLPQWESLVRAGIVAHVEGIPRGGAEKTTLQVLAEQVPDQPFAPWFGAGGSTEKSHPDDVSLSQQEQVRTMIEQFLAACAKDDTTAQDHLGSGFLYNDAIDRVQFLAIIRACVAATRGGGTAVLSADQMMMSGRGDTVIVDCRLTTGTDKAGASSEQRVSLRCVQVDGRWLIVRWNRTAP